MESTSGKLKPRSEVKTCPNPSFALKAESCLKELQEWTEYPQEVVSFTPDNRSWFGHRQIQRYTMDELSSLQWGKGDEFILDFGTHRVGYLRFRLEVEGINIDAPARVKFTFGEVTSDVAEELHPCKSWISSSWIPDDTMNIDWLPCDVDFPRRHAFRYVRIQIIDTSQKYKVRFTQMNVRAVSAVSPSDAAAVEPLPSQDALLREIDRVSQLTLRDCMQTVFEDGPRQDRRLWSGDLRLQAQTNYCTFKNYDLVKRCLYLFAALPGEDGSLPACLYEKPVLVTGSDYIVDYDALFGTILYDYAVASGDLETANDLWETTLNSLKRPLSYVSADGLFDGNLGEDWKFLDWAPELDINAGMHGLLLFCLSTVNKLAILLGKAPPHEEMVKAMALKTQELFDKNLGVFVSGPSHQISWHSQAWITLSGFVPKDQAKQALLNTMKIPTAKKPLCPYGWATFAEALAFRGAEEECLELIRSYWGGMVNRGADTFWECFDPEDPHASPYDDFHNNSFCHAWSCTPSYLLRVTLKDYLERVQDE
jgi:alpha-L-rhamnosidase